MIFCWTMQISSIACRQKLLHSQHTPGVVPCQLPPAGVLLLKQGIEGVADVFRLQCKFTKKPVLQLREFLAHSEVRQSDVWTTEFGCRPPRGVIVRLARRAGAVLHVQNVSWNYSDKDAFIAEIRLMESWYQQPRKNTESIWHFEI